MSDSNWKAIELDAVKGILCDLDDTLYAYEPCNRAGYAAAQKVAESEFGLNAAEFDSQWKAGRQKVHSELAPFAAGHSRLLYAQKFGEQYFGRTNPHFTLRMEEVYWSVFLDTMKWDNEAELFLTEAIARNIPVCIVTDLTTQIQLRKWIRLDLGRFAKYLASSEEAGYEKPEPSIFKLALEKLNVSAGEAIMIGDSMRKDIEGAKALGIRAYHIERK